MASYLEILAKFQHQTLENLKQIQAAQVATLHTARELVASLPSVSSVPNVPIIEGMPTIAQLTELNTSFATQLLEQQKAYAAQLTEVFSPAVKASAN
jgi:hypothetical protein